LSNYFYSSIRYTILRLFTSLLFSFCFCRLFPSVPSFFPSVHPNSVYYFLFRVSKHVILNLLIIITLMTMMMQEIACSRQEHKKDLNCNILWEHNCRLIVWILIVWFEILWIYCRKFSSDSVTVVPLKCFKLLIEILWINNLKEIGAKLEQNGIKM